MTPNLALEERLAHLNRAVDDLSDVVTRQGREIDRLTRIVSLLAERELGREMGREMGHDMDGEAPAANQKPPHW